MSQDWTTGPAKWAAVIILGAASVTGLTWSIATRARAAPTPPPAPTLVIPPDHALRAPRPPGPSASASRRININTAPASELELLPGVGPAMAARIVEYRTTNGAFRSVEDLDNVKGIGNRTLDKLRPLVTVE